MQFTHYDNPLAFLPFTRQFNIVKLFFDKYYYFTNIIIH